LRQQDKVTAMIDISDGLSTDMAHICTESRVSAVLLAEAIPYSRPRQPRPQDRSKEDVRRFHFALHGGEDYELLFTAPRGKTIPAMVAGTRITKIGEIVELKKGNARLSLVRADGRIEPLQKAGWEHFSSSGDKSRIV
jgi:thiamine-monophosphate kinase